MEMVFNRLKSHLVGENYGKTKKKKERNTFYRRGIQKVPDDRQENWEAD